MYFCHIENFAYGENNERSFSNPHPWNGQMAEYPGERYTWDNIVDPVYCNPV